MEKPPILDMCTEPEVNEFGVGPAVPVQKDVFELDVAVYNVQSVHVFNLYLRIIQMARLND